MKVKLKKFTQFASEILPHESSYLLRINQFTDKDNIKILNIIDHNAHNSSSPLPYDTSIDKRKYSGIMRWIDSKLQELDVDFNFVWINELDRKVMTDTIDPINEKRIFKAISTYQPHSYYFVKFYELLQNFRHFLLIRLRLQEHKTVNDFIEKYQTDYDQCKYISQKIHTATEDIIEQYTTNKAESKQWESWLKGVFYNDKLDGRNRYFAVVRLTFIYFNYREFDKLKLIYDDLDKLFHAGIFYSRRILLNYYSNRVLLHSKFEVLQQAEEYGYLSIKQKNADYLQYLNNFCAILLRQGKNDEALNLMRESFSELRKSTSVHNKIGFASFYINCLVANKQADAAAKYATSYLISYREEILNNRWHIFFVSYLKSLLSIRDFHTIVKLSSRYQLLKRDAEYQKRPIYTPVVLWYVKVADYMEDNIEKDELVYSLQNSLDQINNNTHKLKLMLDVLDEIKLIIPDINKKLKSNTFL